MTRRYLGYHGTTRENADKILSSKQFYPSTGEEEWLGNGIYFFEDDPLQAKYWCIKARKYNDWTVLKSELEARQVIDLVDTETRERFRAIAKKISNRYEKLKNGSPRKLINSVVLDIMYKAEPYDVVRGIFEVPRTYTIGRTNIRPYQIQLCVRNHDCIRSISEVDFGGY